MALSKLRTAVRTRNPHETAAELSRSTLQSTLSTLGVCSLELLDTVEAATNELLDSRGYRVDVLSVRDGTLTVAVTDADRKLLTWDRDVLLSHLNDRFPGLQLDRVHCHRKTS